MIVRKNSMNMRGDDTRGNQLFGRIGAERAHGVDLFGDDHGAEFAGHAGCVASGDHQAGDQRAEFGDHADRNELPNQA